MKKHWGMQTKAIHAGLDTAPRDVSPPLHMANTYLFESAQEAAHAFETEDLPIYTRWGNPTIGIMETKVAILEGAESAVATASGMAAVSAALLAVLKAGDHLIATSGIYSGTYHLVYEDFAHLGIETTQVNATDPEAFAAAIRPNTRALYMETPGNPSLVLNDISALVEIARAHGLITLIDNTFATPYNQTPIKLGVDVVIHSVTKFLGGHGDAMGGAVIGSQEFIQSVLKGPIRHMGGCISPFNAWLIIRGISTFPLRMKRHNENALAVANHLAENPAVAWVRYPWHPSHPQYALAQRQMPGGGGGVVVFELKGGLPSGEKLMNQVQLCARTVSLGDVRTLMTHPASTTHHSLSPAARYEAGISDGLVRLAVGLEDVSDIIDDLDQALV
ncbi:MAG: aminotransferase class I/II-fold pyridoxal phosphate-dependent enzyme [Anaerolineales bacterium]|nr:MAG: aminotransferase class I/II-fold pyridoxal phosphate-dependent enzyme [Anaerolineales bacterium]